MRTGDRLRISAAVGGTPHGTVRVTPSLDGRGVWGIGSEVIEADGVKRIEMDLTEPGPTSPAILHLRLAVVADSVSTQEVSILSMQVRRVSHSAISGRFEIPPATK